ncbi:GNAT family N-acetyltransferase [Halobacteriales archaeon SW_10_68_16]|jgi:GNAT superfamily N-acetyltransferase|nr:MAG: GNAT family N-acetyltransferase [Halobacteriales archaeon SW_10_68_16]
MEFELLGWPPEGPTLHLDHREFAYAGKFVMSATGKAVAGEEGEKNGDGDDGDAILAATAFDEDRTDPNRLRIRYVTVRNDRRGEGIGPRLLRFTAERGRERGYTDVRIAANNPFAYEACYRAGFAFTGEETGLAELVLAYRPDREGRGRYQAGFDRYRGRDLSDAEESFLDDYRGRGPPAVVADPLSGNRV